MNRILIFLALISFTFALKETTILIKDDVSVKMSLPKNDEIKFTISAPESNKWIMIGLGNETKEADFFLIESGLNTTTITDMEFNNKSQGVIKINNNYSLRTEVEEDTSIYTVTRSINTQNDNDFTISDGKNSIFVASGPDSTPEFLEDMSYENIKLEVATINTDDIISETESEIQANALVHGLCAHISWNWLSLILIISGRYSKYFYSFRIILHAIAGILVLILNFIGSTYYTEMEDENSQNFIGDAHTTF